MSSKLPRVFSLAGETRSGPAQRWGEPTLSADSVGLRPRGCGFPGFWDSLPTVNPAADQPTTGAGASPTSSPPGARRTRATIHADELSITPELVRQLVTRDLPARWAELPLSELPLTGSTNRLFRLGDELLVRLPRQSGSGKHLETETKWSAVLDEALPIAVPQVVATGQPGFGYGENWTVVRWVDGVHPPTAKPGDAVDQNADHLAKELAGVVRTLRELPVEDDARYDPALRWYRGGALAPIDVDVRKNIEACRDLQLDLDLDGLLKLWEGSLTLPGAAADARSTGDLHWFHGDIVAENLLVKDGRLVSLLDLGGIGVGDPTVDLHGAWELFDADARETFREGIGVDEPTWLRGRAWAIAISVGVLSYYWHSMPDRCVDRLAMAQNVLADR
ncbi:phosphotransferase [Parenemella sanctibonifatiensis]|uniref:Phosphotransferase n=1 Tax=Parenemella sanctibonifatiensis TaxID=2016505 RepID=A0A255EIG2_9ACTN|nr:phosphotransferase [Parenemella sanctibonifatiensis]